MTQEIKPGSEGAQVPGVGPLQQAREQLLATSRQLTEALGQIPEGLNAKDTLAVQETLGLAQRLEFHEQMQLHRIDKPLLDAGLAFPITPEDLHRADPLECDVFWQTAEVYSFPGNEFAMPLVQTTRGIGKDGTLQLGAFDSIYMTQEAYQKKGGMQIVLLNEDDKVPKGEVQGAIQVDPQMLTEINEKLTVNKRIKLPEELGETVENVPKVTNYHIYPEREASDKLITAFGGDKDAAQKAVNFFYSRGHIALVLELDNGESQVMTFNALGDDGGQGGVNLIRFTDGRYGIVNTVRMLVGAGRKYRPEISRGYADVQTAKFSKIIQEKYGEGRTADQLGMELGLKPSDAVAIEKNVIRQDHRYENVTPLVSILTFDKAKVMSSAPAHVQQLMEEFEGLQPTKVTSAEIIKSVETNEMVDGFSLTTFAAEGLKSGWLVLNPRYAGSSIVLERRAIPQLGNKEILTVPQGPAFEPGLTTVGQVHPNTGDARFWYQVRVSTNPGVLEPGPKYEKVPLQKVLGMLTDYQFTVPDAGSIFKALLTQKVLVAN